MAKKKAETKEEKNKPTLAAKEEQDKKAVDEQVDSADTSPEETPDVEPKTAANDEGLSSVDELLEDLAGPRRRARQEASHELALIAQRDPELVAPGISIFIKALKYPEAQTRWEVLNILTELVPEYAGKLNKAFDGAEDSLFEDGSATVRLAAFRFLALYGATSQKRSDKVWPLLSEAIQCFHGDSEYRDMLSHMLSFAKGKISDASREALAERIRFDAKSGHGYIQSCSAEIMEYLESK